MGALRLLNCDATFIHIRRTGGTSVRRTIQAHNRTDIVPLKEKKHPSISEALAYHGHLGFVFTTVRNPYDRLVSLYHHQKRHRYPGARKPFEKYVYEVADFNDHAKPISEYLDGEVDFVLRYESLEKDYATVCEKIGCKHKKLARHNKSPGKKNYRTYYNEELRKFVYDKYSADFKRFGYSHEL